MSDNVWKDDVLGRQAVAEKLERLISLEPGVINVDAPYGFGKTFLLNRLAQQLTGSGHLCLMIDAWSSDFHTDPVIALFSEFTQQLVSLGLAPGRSKLAQSAKAVGKSLLRRGVPAAVKVATLGVVDLGDMADEVVKAQAEAVADAAGGLGHDLVAQYSSTKKSVEAFKTALEKAAARSAKNGSKMVVILDELDRCRPDYSLRILEVVKHLFLVKGVVFVLGADMRALARAVNLAYGIGSDVDGYLGRLIDCTVRLPSHYDFPERFADHLLGLAGDEVPEREHLSSFFASCTQVWSPSLRTQLKTFRILMLILRLKPDTRGVLLDAVVTLLCFKLYAPKAYARYVKQNQSLEELMKYFGPLAGVASMSRAEISSQSHSFIDSRIVSRIDLIATLLALQMVDDRALRFAFEGGPWAAPGMAPSVVAPFGKYTLQLQSATENRYGEFQKVDSDLYNPYRLREYLDEEIINIT